MKELEKLVEKLEDKNNKEEERVKILQDIGKVLITEYEIIVDGIKIEGISRNFPPLIRSDAGGWVNTSGSPKRI